MQELVNEWLEGKGKLRDGLQHSAQTIVALHLFADWLESRRLTMRAADIEGRRLCKKCGCLNDLDADECWACKALLRG